MQFLKRHQRMMMFLVLLLFLGYMGYLAHAYSQAQRFGDEVGNLVGGHFILEGKTIYKDLQFNHQPAVYYLSAITEKITSPKNLYFYLARQRVGVFIYGAMWILFLTYMFGWRAFIFGILFEMSKYAFQGYKLLSESLAVYPTVYLFIILAEIFIQKKKLKHIEIIFASVSLFFLIFSVTHMWPFAGFAGLVLLSNLWKDKKRVLYFVGPGLGLSLLLFTQMPISNFIKETVTYNFQYFFPALERETTFLQTVLFPLSTLVPPYTSISQALLALGTILLIIYSVLLYKKIGWPMLIVILGLIFANPRADNGWYDSFHLLPWFGALVIINVYLASEAIETYKKKFSYIKTLHVVGLSVLIMWVFTTIPNPVQAKRHSLTENYNNYSYSETYGRAVHILKDDGDTLFVIENDPIVYWVGDIDMATHVLEYYSWILTIPQYRDEIINMFQTNPPTFVFNTGFVNDSSDSEVVRDASTIEQKILEALREQYILVENINNSSQTLYIHKNKLKEVTDDEREQLKSMFFEIQK